MSEVLVCGSTEALKRCSVLSREKLGKILVCRTRYQMLIRSDEGLTFETSAF